MLILGVPSNPQEYYLADEYYSFELQQLGFHPKYKDEDTFYYLMNEKLIKALKKLDIEF